MRHKPFLRYYFPALIWAAVILVLTSYPSISVPDTGFELQDKVAHFGVYFILGLLTARAIVFGKKLNFRRSLSTCALCCCIFAALDEGHQLFIPGRSAEIGDILADFAGIFLALFMFYLYFNHPNLTESGELESRKNVTKSDNSQDQKEYSPES